MLKASVLSSVSFPVPSLLPSPRGESSEPQAQHPVAQQPRRRPGQGPGGQSAGPQPPLLNRRDGPPDQPRGHQRPEGVLLQRARQIPPQRQLGGPGEKAGGAGDGRERPQWAAPARQVGVAALEPEIAGEAGGKQEACLLNSAQKRVQQFRLFSDLPSP